MQVTSGGHWFSRDNAIILSGLLAIVVLSWAYLFHLNHVMAYSTDMAAMGMRMSHSWDMTEFATTFLMWAVMMVAMMAPSAAPMLLTFNAVIRSRMKRGAPYVPTFIFLSGYIAVWTLFSLLAALAQWRLHLLGVFDADRMIVTSWLGSVLLIAAGLFQLSPLKGACLTRCRSPFDFFSSEWLEGNSGAWYMGVRHGVYCAGCCWALMLLLFVAGVMNLLWVAIISLFVLAEKLMPRSRLWSYGSALGFVCSGVLWMLKH